MSLRLALERASHRVVVRRRLPPPFASARIYVSTEGGLRYLARTMARGGPAAAPARGRGRQAGRHRVGHRRQHGAVQLRRGGHGGSGRRVLAVEPDTDLVGLLRTLSGRPRPGTRRWKSCPPRYPMSCRSPGSTSRAATAPRATWRASARAMAGGVRSTQLVPTVTLDWLAARFPAPDVLKIDVEGAELAVLARRRQVLAAFPGCHLRGLPAQHAAAFGHPGRPRLHPLRR